MRTCLSPWALREKTVEKFEALTTEATRSCTLISIVQTHMRTKISSDVLIFYVLNNLFLY